jgi:drug/metabolite transporter (DMT)-like permease
MTTPSAPDPAPRSDDAVSEDQIAWLTRVRGLHRWKRLLCVFGCLAGAVLMLLGRFKPETAPPWALPAGLVVVVLSWALFGWVMYDRWRWVKANPYKPDQ